MIRSLKLLSLSLAVTLSAASPLCAQPAEEPAAPAATPSTPEPPASPPTETPTAPVTPAGAEDAPDATPQAPPPAPPPGDTPANAPSGPSQDAPAAPTDTDVPPTAPAPEQPRAAGEPIYEPPLPQAYVQNEPALPPPPPNVAPNRALWLGARTGWFFPTGSLWQDGEPISGVCCAYYNRGWDDFASSGPMLELDVGARLGHSYNVFAIWEYAYLGDGDELGDEFGGQTSATSNFLGVGLRFSTNPDELGIVVEMALGWRRFKATWDNGTEFAATDDLFNTRIAFGADIRLSETLSLSPMLSLGGGVFGEAEWKLSDGSREGAFSSFGDFLVDEPAQHVPVILQVGLHYDAFASRD